MVTGEAVSQKNEITAEECSAAAPDAKSSVTAKASKSAAKKHRRKVIGIIIAILVIIAIAIPFIQLRIRCAKYYNQGIAYMLNGEYTEAFPYFGYVYAKSPYFKDAHELTDFSSACYFYSETDYQSMTSCINALNRIPADYSGPFADVIRDYRVQAEAAYLPLEAEEQKRLAAIEAERRKQLAEEEAERQKKLKEEERKKAAEIASIPYNPPYVGMGFSYINSTSLGKYAYDFDESYWDSSANRTVYQRDYYWKENGREIYVATVRFANSDCKAGCVCNIIDRRNEKPSHFKPSSDPYEVDYYSNSEDFYYWHEDDFVDFEEAEDYFYSH